MWGFPVCSVGKESACNAGDPGLILGLGRSAGEGIGYPLQYSCVSLVAQLVKNLPAMKETWIWSFSWEVLQGQYYPLQYSGLENSMDHIVHGVPRSQTWLSDFHFTSHLCEWTMRKLKLIPSEVKWSEASQSCLTLCNPMDCSLSCSSVHGIFQARVLERVAFAFSRRSSRPKDWTRVSHIVGRRFTIWATREVQLNIYI